jgi:hypothetical protein
MYQLWVHRKSGGWVMRGFHTSEAEAQQAWKDCLKYLPRFYVESRIVKVTTN